MPEPAWWQRGAIYQIYPRSFADADGDGVGDLKGITAQLDHLEALHVAAIWLSPIFPSPMADFGYDVSDYCDVDPVFGTLGDLDELIAACHARDIKLVLDWVPNHTSDRHPWFVESRSSRESPKRDWYVWRDEPTTGRRCSRPCGDAWTFDEATGQYYLHSFMREQPDLNWDNPEVVAAMHDVLRFWMDRGVDGLRLDAIAKIAKDPLLRDHKRAARRHDEDWESIHAPPARHPQGRRRIRGPDDRGGGGAAGPAPRRRLPRVRRPAAPRAQLRLHRAGMGRRDLRDVDRRLRGARRPTAWPAWFLGNHDVPRPASRFDHDGLGAIRARAILVMLYTLRGTPFIYQGEELGLPDAPIPEDRIVDVDGRDPERAPIPWTPEPPGHGFTTGDAWLPFVTEAATLNAAAQAEDPRSTLNLARALARLRKETPALQTGEQRPYDAGNGILAWTREEIPGRGQLHRGRTAAGRAGDTGALQRP